MSREDPQLRVRIPIGLKKELENKAKENKRTLTAEIIQRLEETGFQDSVFDSSEGFSRIAVEFEELKSEYDELEARYEREYAIEYADAHKDELRETVNKLKDLLTPSLKK